MADNVVPFIQGEEEKLESEPLKMLGMCDGKRVSAASFGISAHCNRVAVSDGHMVCVTAELEQPTSLSRIVDAMESFAPAQSVQELPVLPIRYSRCVARAIVHNHVETGVKALV